VRIGNDLNNARVWRDDFARAEVRELQVETEVRDRTRAIKRLRIEVKKGNNFLSVDTRSPRAGRFFTEIKPEPSQAVLESDEGGNPKEIGRPILEKIEPIRSTNLLLKFANISRKSYKDELDGSTLHDFSRTKIPGYWEAEDGRVWPPMTKACGVETSEGQYVWMPRGNKRQVKGSDVGSVAWRLNISGGTYYIWGRVLTPSRREDSFRVRIFKEMAKPLYLAAWVMGVHRGWTWVPVDLRGTGKSTRPTELKLPAGVVNLQLFAQEAGAKIDRLFITSNPKERPT
jgi:hypothetical protein